MKTKPRRFEAPDRSFRNLVTRDGDRWYWKDIPENNRRNKDFPLGVASEKTRKHYLRLWIGDREYMAHRVIYWLHTNEWPEVVDHIDGNPRNNAFSNLRGGSQQQNMANLRIKKERTHNLNPRRLKDGSIRYSPTIKFMNKVFYCGSYDTEHDALIASLFIRRVLHGERYNVEV